MNIYFHSPLLLSFHAHLCVYYFYRDVAQLGSALVWGASGRGFKSRHPDHHIYFIESQVVRKTAWEFAFSPFSPISSVRD